MTKSKKVFLMAEEVYMDFCEQDGTTNSSFQKAWNRFQDRFDEIESGSEAEDLVRNAIAYGIQACVDEGFYIEEEKETPEK